MLEDANGNVTTTELEEQKVRDRKLLASIASDCENSSLIALGGQIRKLFAPDANFQALATIFRAHCRSEYDVERARTKKAKSA